MPLCTVRPGERHTRSPIRCSSQNQGQRNEKKARNYKTKTPFYTLPNLLHNHVLGVLFPGRDLYPPSNVNLNGTEISYTNWTVGRQPKKKKQVRVANSTVPLIRSIKTAYSTCKDLAQFLPPTYCSAARATTTTPPNSAHLRPCETYQRDGEIHALKWI